MEANSIFVENSPYEMMHLQMSSQHRKKALKFFFMLQSAWWTNFFKEKKKSSHKGRHVDFTFFTNLEISAVLLCPKKHWCSRDCSRHLLTLCHEQETASQISASEGSERVIVDLLCAHIAHRLERLWLLRSYHSAT